MNPFPKHPAPLYLVHLDKPTPFRGRVLEPETYVCDHVSLSILSAYAVPASIQNWEQTPDSTEGTTLVMPGVHGDLLMLTALNMDPGTEVACFPEYAAIIEGSALTPVNLPCVYSPSRDYVNLSHLTERPEVLGVPFVDGLREMGFDVADHLEYCVSPDERDFARLAWPRERKTVRVAFQPFANSRGRTYPNMGELLTEIDKAFDPMPEVLMLCESRLNIPEQVQHRVRQTADWNCSLRQSAAMMAECDILVCPDSVFQHISGAISLPTVALFGPFHWNERVLNKATTVAIQGLAPCAPCRHHSGSTNGADCPPGEARCTILTEGICAAMKSIDPLRAVREMKRILKRGQA